MDTSFKQHTHTHTQQQSTYRQKSQGAPCSIKRHKAYIFAEWKGAELIGKEMEFVFLSSLGGFIINKYL